MGWSGLFPKVKIDFDVDKQFYLFSSILSISSSF